MKSEERDQVYQRLLLNYGTAAQIDIAIEEMSELTKALLKDRRTFNLVKNEVLDAGLLDHTRTDIIDEIADVRIMIRQLELAYQCEEEVEGRIDYKIYRQIRRMEGDI